MEKYITEKEVNDWLGRKVLIMFYSIILMLISFVIFKITWYFTSNNAINLIQSVLSTPIWYFGVLGILNVLSIIGVICSIVLFVNGIYMRLK